MIIFTDLSGVLIRGFDEVEDVIKRDFGEEVANQFRRAFKELRPDFLRHLRGEISEAELLGPLFYYGDWPFTKRELGKMLSHNLRFEIPGTLDVFKSIVGYPESVGDFDTTIVGAPPIYIVSDHTKKRSREVQKLHPEVFRMAEWCFWSWRIGKIKADIGFFPGLLDDLGCTPQEVIFIDDLQVNIDAARSAGITGILFKNALGLYTQLCRLGFEFKPIP